MLSMGAREQFAAWPGWSQRVGAKRRPMTGSAPVRAPPACGDVGPNFASAPSEPPALLRSIHERSGQRFHVVPHHLDVGWRAAIRPRQRVGEELAADAGTALLRDPLHEPRISDVLEKDGRNLLLPD